MLRIGTILLFFIGIAFFMSCGKNGSSNQAALLYGKWENKTMMYDTLFFLQRAGKNIMLSRISFNPSASAAIENEYRLIDGKLLIGWDNGGQTDFVEFSTFHWLQVGKKFELNGNQRFPFLSSIQPMYTYEKLK